MSGSVPPAAGRWLGRRFLVSCRGHRIPAYTAMLALGCGVGVVAGAAAAGRSGLDEARVALATVVLLAPALVGSRLWFVLEHWSRFRAEPRCIWRRSEGGMGLNGGLILSVGVSSLVLPRFDLPFWGFWDAASFTMLVGLIFTRAGCLMNGCCAGRASSGPLGLWLPNDRGEWERRIPTQMFEATWGAAVLVCALFVRSRLPFDGALFLGVLAAYGCVRTLLEPMRERPRERAASYTNMAFSALLALGASIAVVAEWPA